ncbi:MAG: porin [Flavobacteriaceae bacterium]
MKLYNTLLFVFTFTFISVNAQEPAISYQKSDSTAVYNPYTAEWGNGFKFHNADNSIKLKFGGRIMFDSGFFSLNAKAESNGYELLNKSGHEIRRGRIFTAGTIYSNIDFKLQIEFAGNKVHIKDAFITIKDIPYVGNFIVGRFIEPFRLEAITSSKYTTFMERGLPYSFFPDRNTGGMIFNQTKNKRMSWQAGIFRGVSTNSIETVDAGGDYAITTRVAGSVIDKDNLVVHLGGAYSFRKPQEHKTITFSAKPEVHMAEKYIKVLETDVDNVNMFSVESALVAGSFSFQAEYVGAQVKKEFDTGMFNSYYAQVSYFLTGEKRKYQNSLIGFGRVRPKKNFGKNGAGAFEVAFRYSYIDGTDTDKMSNITGGVNWHLNPATRIMANYIVSNIDNNTQYTGKGKFTAFQLRFQIDF